MAEARSLVLLAGTGVAGAAVTAVSGNQSWVTPADGAGETGDAVAQVATTAADSSSPLTAAVALVVLAAWGVVLVTRGRFRVAVAWLTAVASVALLVVGVAGFVQAPGQLADLLDAYGAPDVGVDRTAWPWLAVAGSCAALLAAGLSLRTVRSWPEMGRRYDAPTGDGTGTDTGDDTGTDVTTGPGGPAGGTARPPAETENIDLWKAMDRGHDPTA